MPGSSKQALYGPLLLSVLLLLPMLLPEGWQSLLEYHRQAIFDGQAWRFVSGHLTHLSWGHLAMNLVGYWLIWEIFFRHSLTTSSLFYTLILLALGTSFGLMLLSPEIAWYRGFSGVLHGLLVWGLLRGMKPHFVSSSLMLVLILCKLAWEQLGGALPGSESMAGGKVIVDAHLYGAVTGALLLPLEAAFSRLKRDNH